ncbi:MAG: hypothetical protein CSA70_05975 [Rhodobacterales bacterium]|nr:MAG: hypothetical protein CSA70_05975 [Rhodobacterales bacterium]
MAQRPIEIVDFDQDRDLLVLVIDEFPGFSRHSPDSYRQSVEMRFHAGTDPQSGFDRAGLEVTLTLSPPDAGAVCAPTDADRKADAPLPLVEKTVFLPGLRQLDPRKIRVLVLEENRPIPITPTPASSAGLTGDGLYPHAAARYAENLVMSDRLHLSIGQDWRIMGPPEELFFDLSAPDSALRIDITGPEGSEEPDSSRSHIYAIRLTEDAKGADWTEQHMSVILLQTAPGVPRLNAPDLAALIPAKLGHKALRAVAWVWLGSEGSYRDSEAGDTPGARWTRFGRINRKPRLTVNGPLSMTLDITRSLPQPQSLNRSRRDQP